MWETVPSKCLAFLFSSRNIFVQISASPRFVLFHVYFRSASYLFIFFAIIFTYLFSCVRSQLWHAGSRGVSAVVLAHRLWCLVASGILVPQLGIKPCIGRWILNHSRKSQVWLLDLHPLPPAPVQVYGVDTLKCKSCFYF